MGYIIKRIQFAGGALADENGKSNFDYYAYFDEKDMFKKKDLYKSVDEALADGCKLILCEREGMKLYHVVQGVNPDMVSKIWCNPRNEEDAKAIQVNYHYTSMSQADALKWLSKNLPIISSPYGINVHLLKFDEEKYGMGR